MSVSLKRLLTMLTALAFVAAACGGSDDSGAEGSLPDNCGDEDVICVGLVTDTGKVDDKSFNQSAWEGLQAAAEADDRMKIEFIETIAAADYGNNIGSFTDRNADMIVTVGFGLGEATGIAADENPETTFIGVDQFQGEVRDNVTGIIFPEDQAGFMAGALAGLMTTSNTVGAVLGTDLVPPVVAFKEGFENGAKYVNAEVNLISTYHPGGLDTAFGDPAWGADTARQAINNGADVIFGAGGATGNGALTEVAKEDGAFCIGVDTDQWETVPEAQPCLITSAMKLIDKGVTELVAQGADGTIVAGNFIGDVGLAPYHDFEDTVPDEVKTTVDQITADLLSGSLETGYVPG
ncbi:MAG: BMP family ABC transporter substrate-binding protein [Acidimicrobiales bacterium]